MRYFKNHIFLVLATIFLSSCVSKMGCEAPGPALVKVFMDNDGLPNVNIETVIVYPGQKLIFERSKSFSYDFELVFATDPENPSRKDVKFKSKEGKVSIKVSQKYGEVLDKMLSNKDAKTLSRGVYIDIKYNILANGKERDPNVRIIPH